LIPPDTGVRNWLTAVTVFDLWEMNAGRASQTANTAWLFICYLPFAIWVLKYFSALPLLRPEHVSVAGGAIQMPDEVMLHIVVEDGHTAPQVVHLVSAKG